MPWPPGHVDSRLPQDGYPSKALAPSADRWPCLGPPSPALARGGPNAVALRPEDGAPPPSEGIGEIFQVVVDLAPALPLPPVRTGLDDDEAVSRPESASVGGSGRQVDHGFFGSHPAPPERKNQQKRPDTGDTGRVPANRPCWPPPRGQGSGKPNIGRASLVAMVFSKVMTSNSWYKSIDLGSRESLGDQAARLPERTRSLGSFGSPPSPDRR